MTKQPWPGQQGAVRIAATVALLLVAGRAIADGAPATLPVSPEQDAREKQAMALHDEARELHAHGRYRAAVAKLEAALALDPHGKELVYNLALIHERLGEIDPAVGYYRRYLEAETDPREREKIEGVLQRLEGAKQDLVAPAGSPAAPVAAPVVAPSRSFGPWVIVSGAVGAMGLFTGVVLGISALARSPGASAATGPGVTADDLLASAKAAHRQAVGADIALLIGLAATGAAVGIHLGSRASAGAAPKPPPPRVDLALGPLAGALRVSF
ncbi:MAG: tetratricopeptide repeat protein [Byssovorax sp.]